MLSAAYAATHPQTPSRIAALLVARPIAYRPSARGVIVLPVKAGPPSRTAFSADHALLCRFSTNQRSTGTSAGEASTAMATPDAAIHQSSADVVNGDFQVARTSFAA